MPPHPAAVWVRAAASIPGGAGLRDAFLRDVGGPALAQSRVNEPTIFENVAEFLLNVAGVEARVTT